MQFHKVWQNFFYLNIGHAKLLATPSLSNFRQVINQPFKYVCSIQITIIVHVDVHHTLGIYKKVTLSTLEQKLRSSLKGKYNFVLQHKNVKMRAKQSLVPAHIRVRVCITIHL